MSRAATCTCDQVRGRGCDRETGVERLRVRVRISGREWQRKKAGVRRRGGGGGIVHLSINDTPPAASNCSTVYRLEII